MRKLISVKKVNSPEIEVIVGNRRLLLTVAEAEDLRKSLCAVLNKEDGTSDFLKDLHKRIKDCECEGMWENKIRWDQLDSCKEARFTY